MHIRESTEEDSPAIVDLLKKSLGDNMVPKSVDYWLWKHIQNPFGPSKVLLAESNGQLIGVRAMMQWKWQLGDQYFSTLRAVDTATHPEFQRKGIFSILTQKIIDHSQGNGTDFIFNTPNTKSFPGYLKLGWVSLGNVSVGFSFLTSLQPTSNESMLDSINFEGIEQLCSSWNLIHQKKHPFSRLNHWIIYNGVT